MNCELKCCLCLRSLTDSTSRKKRKKLYSDTCSQSKQVLEELLCTRSATCTLSDFQETKGRDVYLCYQCDAKAVSLYKLQQKVTAVRNELLDMLKNLNEITTVPASARKRLCLSTEYRRDKRPRLDTQHDQQLTSAYQLSESISQPSAFTPSPTGHQSPSISLASTSQLLPSTPSTPLASTSPPSHNVFDLEPDAINTDVTATTNPESVIKSSISPALSVSVTKFYAHNLTQG